MVLLVRQTQVTVQGVYQPQAVATLTQPPVAQALSLFDMRLIKEQA
jgi:hypothetical protein